MSESRLLIVFAKNPEEGHVKTRLAESVGDKKALEVYRDLLDHTLEVAGGCDCNRELWFSRYIPEKSEWEAAGFQLQLQQGENLGVRMKKAFQQAFKNEYQKAVIIGSDCAELTSDILEHAFRELDKCDLAVGPSEDGGYYLLGMKRFHGELFKDISWSTDKVLQQTMERAEDLDLNFSLLPELNDVDNEADWQSVKRKFSAT